ncbi:PCMD domain-containing protein [uncultured Chitinophaga sp.]
MAIVASSSKDGDQYRGAIGSRLLVDSLSIIQ